MQEEFGLFNSWSVFKRRMWPR